MSTRAASAERWRKAFLGRTRRFDVGVVDALWAQRYAVAIDDLNPIYFDDAAAVAAGYRGTVVPLNYVATIRVAAVGGPTESEMQRDGLPVPVPGPTDAPELAAMGGGQELIFHNPVHAGETLIGDATIVRADEREGRSGPMLIVEEEIAYRSADGEPKLTLVQTTLYRVLSPVEPRDAP